MGVFLWARYPCTATSMPKFSREIVSICAHTLDRGVHGSLQVDQLAHLLQYHAMDQYAAGCEFHLGDSKWKSDRSGVFSCKSGHGWLICSVRILLLAGRKTAETLQAFTYRAVLSSPQRPYAWERTRSWTELRHLCQTYPKRMFEHAFAAQILIPVGGTFPSQMFTKQMNAVSGGIYSGQP